MFQPGGSTTSNSGSTGFVESTTATTTKVKSKSPTKGSENVNQMTKKDATTLLKVISKFADGITQNLNLITEMEYEEFKKTNLIVTDKIIKSLMNALADGEVMSIPNKGMAIYIEKVSMESEQMEKEIKLNYPCPCGSSYNPTTSSTDPEALDGSIDPTKATTMTATKQAQSSTTNSSYTIIKGGKISKATADGMCSVTIPSLNTISNDIST